MADVQDSSFDWMTQRAILHLCIPKSSGYPTGIDCCPDAAASLGIWNVAR